MPTSANGFSICCAPRPQCGDIPGDVDLDSVVTMLMIIADGVWWRRALDPQFDAAAVVPMFMDVARHLLRGRPKVPTNGKNPSGNKSRNLNKKSVPDIEERAPL